MAKLNFSLCVVPSCVLSPTFYSWRQNNPVLFPGFLLHLSSTALPAVVFPKHNVTKPSFRLSVLIFILTAPPEGLYHWCSSPSDMYTVTPCYTLLKISVYILGDSGGQD